MQELEYFQQQIAPNLDHLVTQGMIPATFEQAWLRAHLSSPALSSAVTHLSPLGLQTLQLITATPQINGARLADQLNVTKGAVSKTTSRLIDLNLISATKQPGDRKTVHYAPTVAGQQLNATHLALQALISTRLTALLSGYTHADLATVAHFLQDLRQVHEDPTLIKPK